jgi:histidyl-tRNA synthetase
LVAPRTLRGFRDLLPEVARFRELLVQKITTSFVSFGFRPIVTPALEYAEILRGKGSPDHDRQMFEFVDHGGRDVGLRFDLTVPLARFVAEHQSDLAFPFRAYQIGPVWRGERPQRGRFREFVQCDADIVGTESSIADAEIVAMMHATLSSLDIRPFVIRLNDRRILAGVLEVIGATEQSGAVLRALDKTERDGTSAVRGELIELGLGPDAADTLLGCTQMSGGPDDRVLEDLEKVVTDNVRGRAGIDALRTVRDLLDQLGVPSTGVGIDPSIVRGLDYYTGVVFETTYHGAPSVGSICSGGRYDDLTLVYSKTRAPGVGGSIGIDRLVSAVLDVEEIGLPRDPRLVVLGATQEEEIPAVLGLATGLRERGLAVDVHPDLRPAKNHRRYADRRGAAVVGTAVGSTIELHDLHTGSSKRVTLDEAVTAVVDLTKGPAG